MTENKADEVKKLLSSHEEADRKKGVYVLAQAASRDALNLLQKIAETDESVEIRFFARKAVGFVKTALKPKILEKVPETFDLAKFNWGKAPIEEKLSVVQFSINKNLKNNLRFFIDVLKKEPDAQVKSALIIAIGKFGGEESIDALTPWLDHESPRVRANTIDALELLGSSKARILAMTRLDDPDNRVRANAVRIAKDIAPARILQVVSEMLTSPQPAMQASGAYILQFLPGDRNALLLEPLLQSTHPSVKQNAIQALMKFREKKVKKAEELWRKWSLDKAPAATAQSLETLKKESEFSLPQLTDNLEDLKSPDPEKRLKTLHEITGGGEAAGRAILQMLTKESDVKIIAKALIILGQIRFQEAIPTLSRYLEHPDARCRANAIEALGLIGSESALKAVPSLLRDTNNRVKANAIIALKNTPECDIAEAIAEMARSPEELMQRSVVYAIVEIADPRFFHHLEELARSDNREVAKTAKKALMSLESKPVESRHQLKASEPEPAGSPEPSDPAASDESSDILFPAQMDKFHQFFGDGQFDDAVKTAAQVVKDTRNKEIPESRKQVWRKLLADSLFQRGQLEMKKSLARIPLTFFKADNRKTEAENGEKTSREDLCGVCDTDLSEGFVTVTLHNRYHCFCGSCGEKLDREARERHDRIALSARYAVENVLLACELDETKTFPPELEIIAGELELYGVTTAALRLKLGLFHFDDAKLLLTRNDPKQQLSTALLLGEFGPSARDHVPEMVKALADAPPEVKNNLLTALKKIGPDNVPGSLAPETVSQLIQHEMDFLLTGNPGQRREALEWLPVLNPGWNTSVDFQTRFPSLLKELAEGKPENRVFLIGLCQRLGAAAETAIPVIAGLLSHWETTLIEPAKKALAAIDSQWASSPAGSQALLRLVQHLPQFPTKTQSAILSFLSSLVAPPEEVGQALENLHPQIPDEGTKLEIEHTLSRVFPQGFSRLAGKRKRQTAIGWAARAAGFVVYSLLLLFVQFSLAGDKPAGFILYKSGLINPDQLVSILSLDLSGGEHQQRMEALNMMGHMGRDAEAGLPVLVNAFFDKDPDVRSKIGQILPLIHSDWHNSSAARKAITVLIPQLLDKDVEVRTVAAENLELIDHSWPSSPEAKAAIPELIATWNLPDKETARLAEDLVARIKINWANLTEAQPALPGLEKALLSTNSRIRRRVMTIYGRIAPADKSVIPKLVEGLLDFDEEVRQAAELGLEFFAKEWTKHPDVLNNLSPVSKRLNSKNPLERRLAMEVLGRCEQGGNVLPSILAELVDAPEGRAAGIFQVLDKTHRDWPNTEPGQATLRQFQTQLADPKPETRLRALKFIARFRTGAKSALNEVVNCLLDPLTDIRFETLAVLKAIDPQWVNSDAVKSLLPGLRKNLQTNDLKTLLYTLGMAQRLGRTSEPLLPDIIVISAISDSEEVRDTAEKALRAISKDWMQSERAAEAIPGLLTTLNGSSSPETRIVILSFLEKLGSRAVAAVPELVKIVNNEASHERMDAIRILGSIGPAAKDAGGDLKKLIDHPSFEMRTQVIAALEKIFPGWKVTDEIGNH